MHSRSPFFKTPRRRRRANLTLGGLKALLRQRLFSDYSSSRLSQYTSANTSLGIAHDVLEYIFMRSRI